MAKASNSTGFEDQIDFKSLTGLVRKYKRHVASKPPPEESIWKHKVNFSPRQYKHNSPPRLQNFMCSYRALSPAAEARKKAEERRRFLPSSGSMFRHSVRPKCGQSLGGTELPNASFATVFRIAKPFDVKLQAANESNEHRSLYSDPEIFEFRQLEDPKYYFKPQWSSRMTPDPLCIRSKTTVLPERQAYRVSEHCFRDVDPGRCFNTLKTPHPQYDPNLLFKRDPYPDTAYESLLGRIEGSFSSRDMYSNSHKKQRKAKHLSAST